MIIWQGLGFLVVVILVAATLIVTALFEQPAMLGYREFENGVAFFLAALLTLFLGLYLKGRKTRTLIDEASGERVEIRPRHTLFFIPVLFWSAIFAGLGIWFLVREPPPKAPEGSLIRPLGYLCDSEKGMREAIGAISAAEQPVNYDQLPESARPGRLLLLERLEGCGIVDESSLPIQFESRKMWREEHAGRNWRIAQVRLRQIQGQSLKIRQQMQSVWMFHRHETEADDFLQMEDGKKW